MGGADDGADPGSGRLLVDEAAGIGPVDGEVWGSGRGLGRGGGLDRAEDGLLLVTGAAAQDRVEPQPNEQGHHRQEDNLDHFILRTQRAST